MSSKLDTNAKHNLAIKARTNTKIIWRGVSLTHDSEYRVDLTGFTGVDTSYYSQPAPGGGADVWESWTTSKLGGDAYWVEFEVSRGDEKRLFYWDPWIEVIAGE